LHILSLSVFVEFVCLLVQLLLVTCVSSLFHLTLAVTPPPLGSPSLSRGAVGQKKGEKKEKKGKQSKKRNKKKRENPKEKRDRRTVHVGNGNRFVSVQEFCAVTIRHRFVLVEGVFRGVRLRFFATAYRTSPAILHGKTTTPQHAIFRAWPYF
jgi:hypothetical protein